MKRMKVVTLKWTLMVMMFSSMVFSCKKENNSTPECKVNMTTLAGSYKLAALQYKSSATATPVDYLAFMDACEKDNILILKTDGTYDSNDAGTVCNPSEAGNGTWHVEGNTLTSDGTLNGTIASYDCNTLIYYIENSIKEGDRLTFTLVKQ